MDELLRWSLEHLSPSLSQQSRWDIQTIGANLSNRTWLVNEQQNKATQTAYLVKHYQHNNVFGRDAKRLLALERYVAEQGIAPQIYFADEAAAVVIYEYLTPNLLALEYEQEVQIQYLAQALARIHQLTPQLPQQSLQQKLEGYCQVLAQYKPMDAARLREDVQAYQSLLDKNAALPQVFCHNDLSMEHIFLTPELKVIDWEYASYNHPAMDIAMAVVMNDLHEGEICCLVEEYNRWATYPLRREELPDWLRLVALVNHIWFKLSEAVAEQTTASKSAS